MNTPKKNENDSVTELEQNTAAVAPRIRLEQVGIAVESAAADVEEEVEPAEAGRD